jgi:hypothetical protein
LADLASADLRIGVGGRTAGTAGPNGKRQRSGTDSDDLRGT